MAFFQEAMEKTIQSYFRRLRSRTDLKQDEYLLGAMDGVELAMKWAQQEMRQEDTEAEYLAKTSQVGDTTPGTGANHQEDQ